MVPVISIKSRHQERNWSMHAAEQIFSSDHTQQTG